MKILLKNPVLYSSVILFFILSLSLLLETPFLFLSFSFLTILITTIYSGALMGGLTALISILFLSMMVLYSLLPLSSLLPHILTSLLLVYGLKEKGFLYNHLLQEENTSEISSLIERLPIGYGRSSEDGQMIMANTALVEMLGYESREEFLEKETMETYIDPEDRGHILKELQKRGSIEGYKVMLKKRDGQAIWVSLTERSCIKDGETFYDYCFVDISREEKAKEKLLKRELELQTILHGIKEQVMYLATDYTILWLNREAREDDYYKGEKVGEKCYRLWEREEPCDDCPITETIKTGEKSSTIVMTIDGRSWNLRAYPVFSKRDELAGVIKIAEDSTHQVATRRSIEESEEKYRSLFENMFHGFSYCKVVEDSRGEIVDYIYLDVNRAFAKAVGKREEEIEGKRVTEIYPTIKETSFNWIETYGRVAQTGEAKTFVTYFEIDRRWYRIHAFSYEKGYFGLLFDDITVLKERELELEKTKDGLQVTLESIGDGVITSDIEGRVLFMNKKAEDLTGWNIEEAKARSIQEVFPIVNEKTKEVVKNPVEKVLKTGQIQGLANNTLLISRDGTERIISDSAAPIISREGVLQGVVMVFRDTTLIKEAEKRLLASEEKYRSTFDNTGTAMVIIENDRSISLVNHKLIELLGLSREEIEGEDFIYFIHPEYIERMKEYHQKRRQGVSTLPNQYEIKIITPSREVKDVLLIVTYLPSTGQSIGSLINITPMKEMEKELKSSRRKIEALHQVAKEMNRAFDEEEICRLTVTAAKSILFFYHSLVTLVEGDRLVVKAVEGKTTDYLFDSVSFDDGIMGVSYKKGKTIITPNIQKSREANPRLPHYRSGLSVPMGDLGVFQAMSDEWNSFSKEDAKMAELLVSHALEGLRRIRSQREIRYLSFHDTLTGLYNRAFFEEELRRLSKSRQMPLSLIMGDINGLKLVNDAFGHQVGDQLLKKITEILLSSCRQEDIIARWGGDEFIILLPQTSAEEVGRVCNRIKERCDADQEMPLPVTIALGTATRDTEDMEPFALISDAENMMLKHKLIETRSVRSSILNILLKTLKEKSNETEEHAMRLQALAIELGKRMNLSHAELDSLSLLVSLHDIGKIVIPQRILEKKERLTDEEWETIKTHSEVGYRIALSSEDFAHIAEEILAHHEWWDGSGYPQGLKGEEIPLNSRITSIVDAYDVMTNHRPYKEKKTKEESITELLRCSGTQFDLQLVLEFVALLKEY